jgi:hypothetical protein
MDLNSFFSAFGTQAPPPPPPPVTESAYGYGSYIIWIIIILLIIYAWGRLRFGGFGLGPPPGYGGYPVYGSNYGYNPYPVSPWLAGGNFWWWIIIIAVIAFIFYCRR